MKHTFIGAGFAALAATSVAAGGIERASNDYGVLFADGSQVAFSLSFAKPKVSGDYDAALGGGSTGDMADDYVTTSASYKMDIGENLSFGLFRNKAYGANATYSAGAYTGLTADWDSDQTAMILKYSIGDRFSVYGGARYVQSSATITIPDQLIRPGVAAGQAQAQAAVTALTNLGVPATDPRMIAAQTQLAILTAVVSSPFGALQYDAQGDRRGDWGYVVGAAYEIPDIALRVGLTYESSITHKFDTTETMPGFGLNARTQTEVEMPQSVSLDFQTGIAAGTLLFGKIKWTEWSKWEVRTPGYEGITGGRVTGLDNDTITYNIGVGRQFSENLSGFAQLSYEQANGGIASRLSPTDGMFGIGVGGQYTNDNVKIRGGIQYVTLGDAVDGSNTQFSGNSAFGFGLQATFSF